MKNREINKWGDIFDRCEWCGAPIQTKNISNFCSKECGKMCEEFDKEIEELRNRIGYT